MMAKVVSRPTRGINLDYRKITSATTRPSGIGSRDNSDYLGTEIAGRGSDTFAYPDPYLRKFIASNEWTSDVSLPGELLGGLNNANEIKRSLDQATDNITNYELQVSP